MQEQREHLEAAELNAPLHAPASPPARQASPPSPSPASPPPCSPAEAARSQGPRSRESLPDDETGAVSGRWDMKPTSQPSATPLPNPPLPPSPAPQASRTRAGPGLALCLAARRGKPDAVRTPPRPPCRPPLLSVSPLPSCLPPDPHPPISRVGEASEEKTAAGS